MRRDVVPATGRHDSLNVLLVRRFGLPRFDYREDASIRGVVEDIDSNAAVDLRQSKLHSSQKFGKRVPFFGLSLERDDYSCAHWTFQDIDGRQMTAPIERIFPEGMKARFVLEEEMGPDPAVSPRTGNETKRLSFHVRSC
jgi:hypothetical protein